MKPTGDMQCSRPELFSIPWTAIKYMRFKANDAPSVSNPICDMKIKTKARRIYNLRFSEKESGILSNIVKNFRACHEYFSQPQFFFAFDVYERLKEIEDKHKGWKIYDIRSDFSMQGLDILADEVLH